MIVDINTQDNDEWMRITKSHEDISFEAFKAFQQTSKLHRFESAFNNFFDVVKFSNVDNTNQEGFEIVFEKYGRKISLDNLSTGEKQIVFRGAHLLKNINSISGGTVLIDEPELSMHPKWQEKVLQYYRGLFEQDGSQNAQIIIATHSEYVLRSALADRDNVLVIVLNDDNGTIRPKKIIAPTILPTITSAETNYLAFGIPSADYHIELYGHLQNRTENYTVKSCDEYIYNSSSFNSKLHGKESSFKPQHGNPITYRTLPTFIRNAIDHPNTAERYTKEELERSIELLIELCQ